jgi:hypothetical protein
VQNNTGGIDYGSQDWAEMHFDSILKQDNKLLSVDGLSQGFIPGADRRPHIVQQLLDFAHDKCPAGLPDPRPHSRIQEELIHSRYAAKFVLKRFLAHRCILARQATGQVRIDRARPLKIHGRPSGRNLPGVQAKGFRLMTGEDSRKVLRLEKSGSEKASGGHIV